MADSKMAELETAILDAVRRTMNKNGIAERHDVGKYCRTIVNDYDSPGPTLWTEATTRRYADTLDELIEKGYKTWRTYLLQIEITDKGRQFIADNQATLDSIPQVDDSRDWFKKQNKRMAL